MVLLASALKLLDVPTAVVGAATATTIAIFAAVALHRRTKLADLAVVVPHETPGFGDSPHHNRKIGGAPAGVGE